MNKIKLSTVLILVSTLLVAFIVRPNFLSLIVLLINVIVLATLRRVSKDEA